ncbi:MAG: DNA helicase RecQ [Pseudomonadales bacterium]
MRKVLQRYWGFDSLRPLQTEAIQAGIDGQDSLLVMPTGSGKSLCYQVPPIVTDTLSIVISPLIALMKDQVDGLRANGYPAAALHSQCSPEEREAIRAALRADELRLLFVTPERMMSEEFLTFVERIGVRSFTIDEAHCISQWGHDFRKEYRTLRTLKECLPEAAVHAYTATATERVRQDIVDQLGLDSPARIIGDFDRPNLVYRILPATDRDRQILEVIRRHPNEAAIVYCITRKETERLAKFFSLNNVKAAAYHAGLAHEERTRTQEAFAREEVDVVVATVAFGMGIDRSNVRCVIHAAMPKSVEHYQQETGRAGRDGLEAECVLLYSAADAMKWESLIRRSAVNAAWPDEAAASQIELLRHLQGLCSTLECRHRALSRYFGQRYQSDNCRACDVCLGEVDGLEDATTIAQKILSCVYRTGQRFGVTYVAEVLRGADTEKVRQRGHDELSTHGLLREMPEKPIINLIYQLVDQGLLSRHGDDRPVLALNDDARAVLRGEREVCLQDPAKRRVARSEVTDEAWQGVNESLFEDLRELRLTLARARGVPAYVIFPDTTLREMARTLPSTLEELSTIPGVGEKKLAELGERFLDQIRHYCEQQELSMDVDSSDN